jgi:hypothetical protein
VRIAGHCREEKKKINTESTEEEEGTEKKKERETQDSRNGADVLAL